MAEQLALDEVTGQRRTVERHEGVGARRLLAWMARAISSLPVPVSPTTRVGVSLREAARARSNTGRIRAEWLTMRSKP